jgi:glycosyltransferase involved in cell wall biosynthesis
VKTLHVLHVDPRLWEPGGVTTTLVVTARAQRRLGVEVSFAGPPGSSARAPADAGTTAEWSTSEDLDHLARGEGVDVVHLHGIPAGAPPAAPAPCPVVRTVHNHNPYCPTGTKRFVWGEQCCTLAPGPVACTYGRLARRCGSVRPGRWRADLSRWHREQAWIDRTSRLVTFSDYVGDALVAAGVGDDRIDRLPQPVETVTAPPPPSEGGPRVCFLGRIVPNKGLHWLLESLAAADGRLSLDVLGGGPDLAAARRTSDRLGLDDRVRFHGWVDGAERARLVSRSRAVVMPSLWPEPAGAVILEAMALGRPVIASDTGAAPERVVPDETGLLVAAGDRAGLATALDTVVSDPVRLDRWGAAGRRVVEQGHDPADHARALLDVYRSAGARA